MHQKKKRYILYIKKCYPFILALLVILSSSWASQAIWDMCPILINAKNNLFWWIPRTICIVIFIGTAFLLYRMRNVFFRPHTRYLSNNIAEKRKHLVLFLSNLNKELEENGGIPKGLNLSNDLKKDINEINILKRNKSLSFWPWEMPLRAIEHHVGVLETITLICSKESISQVCLFLNICRKFNQLEKITFYLLAKNNGKYTLFQSPSKSSTTSFNGFDFESFDELSSAMWFMLRKFKKNNYLEHEIMIDITSGQKPTSIVGASITFNFAIKAQYVQTNDPWEALSYDIILSPLDIGELRI